MQFPNRPTPGWLTLTAGNFRTLAGSVDRRKRLVYLELVTKSLNNYFPPRTGYGGLAEHELADDRSWFGVTRVFEHPADKPPLDELTRFAPLFTDEADDCCGRSPGRATRQTDGLPEPRETCGRRLRRGQETRAERRAPLFTDEADWRTSLPTWCGQQSSAGSATTATAKTCGC